ncbi:hypothetical protein Pcinc_034750 [Petrolisthes cinctipes]|uniref:Uncharacterized protein n=1 Tax=Petrolisthes cinctipes TaxID=88211 RepID=A0AAE1EPP9_PETCI|nr:hypothetical protein Pcinc_034750 [Petrolisthes cinctipes]
MEERHNTRRGVRQGSRQGKKQTDRETVSIKWQGWAGGKVGCGREECSSSGVSEAVWNEKQTGDKGEEEKEVVVISLQGRRDGRKN